MGGACVVQSVKRPTWAQVTISRWVGSSPVSGSGLTAQSLESASDSVSVSLPLPCSWSVCLFLPLKYKIKNKTKNRYLKKISYVYTAV